MKSFLLFFLSLSLLFALDLQTLKIRSDNKDSKFLSQIISETIVYEDISKIPNDLKKGSSIITEDDYGAKNFYVLNEKGDMLEFQDPFFNEILNAQSGSSFSNMFGQGMVREYDTTSTNNTFKPYVSNTDSVRIGFLEVPNRADHMEKALNDYLLNHSIYPQSIINIQIKNENKTNFLWIFYRP